MDHQVLAALNAVTPCFAIENELQGYRIAFTGEPQCFGAFDPELGHLYLRPPVLVTSYGDALYKAFANSKTVKTITLGNPASEAELEYLRALVLSGAVPTARCISPEVNCTFDIRTRRDACIRQIAGKSRGCFKMIGLELKFVIRQFLI